MKSDLTQEQIRAAHRLKDIYSSKKKILKLSQQKIAEKYGVTQGLIYQYLNGKIPLNYKAVIWFSDSLDVLPTEIYPEILRHKSDYGLTPEERALLDNYRNSDDRGKLSIRRLADAESADKQNSG